jgi:ribose 1,5-bisphosphokinase PhnN
VEAFGYRYAITKIPDYDDITFVLLRYQFVEELKRFYPEAKVIQVEAPVEILLKRIASRGDIVRANANEMHDEIIRGQRNTDYTVSTSQALDETYAIFEDYCKNQLFKIPAPTKQGYETQA